MHIQFRHSGSRNYSDTLLSWLLDEIPRSDLLLVGSGYFDAGILDWIEPPLTQLIRRGGQAHFTIGSNQGQTARGDLDRLLNVLAPGMPLRSSLHVVYIPGSLYHAKTYFASGPGRYAALVGSPNLTVAANIANVEADLLLESDQLEAPLDVIQASLSTPAVSAMPNSYRVNSATDLNALVAMGAIDIPRAVTPGPTGASATRAVAQARRRRTFFPPATRVGGVPAAPARHGTVRRAPAAPGAPPVMPIPTPRVVVFVFSPNDLKQTGTSELSVSQGVRTWASAVTGGPVVAGQGDLMHFELRARLAAAPNTVIVAPEPVRLWSAGGTGGTHQDVRMVLGRHVRSELEDLSSTLFGSGLDGGDIGVLELPADPTLEPVRLTIFRPGDPEFAPLDRLCVRMGRQQKRQADLPTLPALAPWPF